MPAGWCVRIPAELPRVAELRAMVRTAVDAIDPHADEACQDDLVQAVDEAATNAIQAIAGEVGGFAGLAEPADDSTIVAIRRLPEGAR